MLIVYESCDEQFICTPQKEPALLKQYFNGGYERDLEEFDRVVIESGIAKILTEHSVIEDAV